MVHIRSMLCDKAFPPSHPATDDSPTPKKVASCSTLIYSSLDATDANFFGRMSPMLNKTPHLTSERPGLKRAQPALTTLSTVPKLQAQPVGRREHPLAGDLKNSQFVGNVLSRCLSWTGSGRSPEHGAMSGDFSAMCSQPIVPARHDLLWRARMLVEISAS